MGTVRELVDRLNRQYKPDDHVAVAIWGEDDVLERAEERDMSITREQAQSILQQMDSNHDAELGITWDTIDAGLDAIGGE